MLHVSHQGIDGKPDDADARRQGCQTISSTLQTHQIKELVQARYFLMHYFCGNAEVKDRMRVEDIELRFLYGKLDFLEHVTGVQSGVPAHDALWTAFEVCYEKASDPGWKR